MNEIKVFEFNTIGEAESEYFKRREEGTWQMVKAMEIVWSWKKRRNVARFSMKKVEKAYHIDDYMKDITKAMIYGCEVLKNSAKGISEYKKRKMEERIKKLLEE